MNVEMIVTCGNGRRPCEGHGPWDEGDPPRRPHLCDREPWHP